MNQKLKKGLLTASLALVSLISWGAGPNSTSPVNASTVLAPPAWTTVKIECPWSDAGDQSYITRNASYAPTLTKDGATVATIDVNDESSLYSNPTMNHGYEVFIKFPPQSEPGSYSVSVPKGLIKYGAELSGASTLDAVTINFTIMDANSVIVTPRGATEVMPSQLYNITLEYATANQVFINESAAVTLTNAAGEVISNCKISVKGTTVTFTPQDQAKIQDTATPNSSNNTATLNIPAGAFSVDGVDNVALTYSYIVRPVVSSTFTSIPPANNVSAYTISQLCSMQLKSDVPISKVSTSVAAISIKQLVNGSWTNPQGINKATYLNVTKVDDYTIQLHPREVTGTYTVDIDALETGTYRLECLQNTFYTSCNGTDKGNANGMAIGNYLIAGATAARVSGHTPATGEKVFDTDLTSATLSFTAAMTQGVGNAVLFKDGVQVATIPASSVTLSADGKTATIPFAAISNEAEQHEYTMTIPEGFLKQSGGSALPSEAVEFNFIMAKKVTNLGAWSGKMKITPSEGVMAATTEFVLKFYGANSIQTGDLSGVAFYDGTTKKTYTFTAVYDPATPEQVTLKSNNQINFTSQNVLSLHIPEGVLTIYNDEGYYTYAQNLYYISPVSSTTTNIQKSTTGTEDATTTLSPKTLSCFASEANTKINAITVTIDRSSTKYGFTGATNANLYKFADGVINSAAIATFTATVASDKGSVSYKTSTDLSTLTPGVYLFEVPQNALLGYKKIIGGTQAYNVAAIRAAITILDPNQELPKITTSVTDGAMYPIFDSFSVYAPEDCGVIKINTAGRVTVTGPQVSEEGYTTRVVTSTKKRLDLVLAPALTEPGEYTVTLEQGRFTCDDDPTEAKSFTVKIMDKPVWNPSLYEDRTAAGKATLKTLSKVDLKFPAGADVALRTGAALRIGAVTTEKSGTDDIELVDWLSKYSVDLAVNGTTVSATITPPLGNGTYLLSYVSGTITVAGTAYPACEGYITIDDPTNCTISPASGSELKKIDTVTATYSDAYSVTYNASADKPYVVNSDNLVVAEASQVFVNGKVMTIEFYPAVTSAGKYTVVIPAGNVTCKGSALSTTTYTSIESRAQYTLYNPCEFSHQFDPTVRYVGLQLYDIHFPQAEDVRIDATKTATAHFEPSASEALRMMTRADEGNVASDHTVSLTPTPEGEKIDPDKNNSVRVELTPMVTGKTGTITLNYPAGTFICDNNLSPEETALYQVHPEGNPIVGIESLSPDAEVYDVYTPAGICLMRGADAEDLRALEKGVYYINGKGVIIY